MGCISSSTIQGIELMIERVDPNDANAVKQLLADLWGLYGQLNPSSQKKLDTLAAKVSNLAKSP